jgi:hypothetical protein
VGRGLQKQHCEVRTRWVVWREQQHLHACTRVPSCSVYQELIASPPRVMRTPASCIETVAQPELGTAGSTRHHPPHRARMHPHLKPVVRCREMPLIPTITARSGQADAHSSRRWCLASQRRQRHAHSFSAHQHHQMAMRAGLAAALSRRNAFSHAGRPIRLHDALNTPLVWCKPGNHGRWRARGEQALASPPKGYTALAPVRTTLSTAALWAVAAHRAVDMAS